MPEADPLAHLWPVLLDADISFFISCAATTLAIYEHLITVRLEAQQIWKRDPSGATILFIMTRYFMLLNRIFVVIGFYPIRDPASCNTLIWIQAIATSTLIVVLSAVAAIRVYALWNRDYRLLILVMLTGMIPALTNLYFRSASSVYIIPTQFYSCQSAPTAMTAETYKALSIATRVVSIVSDGLVVALTWMKTFKIYSLTRHVKLHADYSALILRDGTVYFLAICVLNLIAILYIVTTGTNLLNDLIVTLSAILMARFLLNLRDQRASLEEKAWPIDSPSTLTLALSSPMSSVRFRSGVLDTMGGTMSMGSGENMRDMDDDGEDEVTRCEFTKRKFDEESVCE